MTEKSPIAIQMNVAREVMGTQFSYITTVPQDISLDDLKDVNNKIMAALEHQELWARLSALHTEIEQQSRQLAVIEFTKQENQAKLDSGMILKQDQRQYQNAIRDSNNSVIRLKTLIQTLDGEQKRLKASAA